MTQLNARYLHHPGPTDVLTFDLSDQTGSGSLLAEIYICVPLAVAQAEVYESSWEEETVRYLVHGVLHLAGFEDETPRDRFRMKQEEDGILGQLRSRFPFAVLGARGQEADRFPRGLAPH